MDIELNLKEDSVSLMRNLVLQMNEYKNQGLEHIEIDAYIQLMNRFIDQMVLDERLHELKDEQISKLARMCGLSHLYK